MYFFFVQSTGEANKGTPPPPLSIPQHHAVQRAGSAQSPSAQTIHDGAKKGFRRRRPCRDTQTADARKITARHVCDISHAHRPRTLGRRHFRQSARVRRSRTPHHQHAVTTRPHKCTDGVLPIPRRRADTRRRRTLHMRITPFQRRPHRPHNILRQSRLADNPDARPRRQRRNGIRRVHHGHVNARSRRFTDDTLHFHVLGMTHDDEIDAPRREITYLPMNARNERTGGIHHGHPPRLGLPPHHRRHPMCGKQHRRPRRNFVETFDEPQPPRRKRGNDRFVVDELVQTIDRAASGQYAKRFVHGGPNPLAESVRL